MSNFRYYKWKSEEWNYRMSKDGKEGNEFPVNEGDDFPVNQANDLYLRSN